MGATPTYIDNHAGTHFFGQNICPIQWNDIIFYVLPFFSEYDDTDHV